MKRKTRKVQPFGGARDKWSDPSRDGGCFFPRFVPAKARGLLFLCEQASLAE